MSAAQGAPAARPAGWARLFGRALGLLLPCVLLLTNVRLLLTPAFLELEYRTPGFPADPYGFTREERLAWSRVALDSLLVADADGLLESLRFADGSAVFNARELRHMDDVRVLTQLALRLWAALLAVIFALAALLLAGRAGQALRDGLRLGAWLTLGLMGALALALGLAFGTVFVGFHELFFEGDTWLFLYSDTLIRLFPERFWRDAFLAITAASLFEAALVLAVLRPRRRGAGRSESG